MAIAIGNFHLVLQDQELATVVTNLFNAFEKYDKWNLLNFDNYWEITSNEEFIPISQEVSSDHHSSGSMYICIHQLKYIHYHGWQAYCEKYTPRSTINKYK